MARTKQKAKPMKKAIVSPVKGKKASASKQIKKNGTVAKGTSPKKPIGNKAGSTKKNAVPSKKAVVSKAPVPAAKGNDKGKKVEDKGKAKNAPAKTE